MPGLDGRGRISTAGTLTLMMRDATYYVTEYGRTTDGRRARARFERWADERRARRTSSMKRALS